MKILKGISYENFDFFNFQKISTFSDFENFQHFSILIFFLKYFFDHKKYIFFNQIFLKFIIFKVFLWIQRNFLKFTVFGGIFDTRTTTNHESSQWITRETTQGQSDVRTPKAVTHPLKNKIWGVIDSTDFVRSRCRFRRWRSRSSRWCLHSSWALIFFLKEL